MKVRRPFRFSFFLGGGGEGGGGGVFEYPNEIKSQCSSWKTKYVQREPKSVSICNVAFSFRVYKYLRQYRKTYNSPSLVLPHRKGKLNAQGLNHHLILPPYKGEIKNRRGNLENNLTS